MTSDRIRFLDEVVSFLEEDVLPDISNDLHFFPECMAKPRGAHGVRVSDLHFVRRNSKGDLEQVNDELKADDLLLEFQYTSADGDSWDELLQQFTVTTDCHHLSIPYSVKWERTNSAGRLKADERFDQGMIRQRIGPREALKAGIEVMLHDYLPNELEQLTRDDQIPRFLKRAYNDEATKLDDLRPTSP